MKCEYGCDKEAKHSPKYGQTRWCCSEKFTQCSGFIERCNKKKRGRTYQELYGKKEADKRKKRLSTMLKNRNPMEYMEPWNKGKIGVYNDDTLKRMKINSHFNTFKNKTYEEIYDQHEAIRRKNNLSKIMSDGGSAHANMFITNPSKPQVALFKLCQELLPYPIMNYPSCGYSIDIAVPSLNLAIEYDGSYWHQDEEYDNKRQTTIEEDGWAFLRYKDYVPDKNELMKDIEVLI